MTQRDLAAEQAAQRRKERLVLLGVLAGVLVLIVGAALGYQAWRNNRSPDASAVTPAPASTPVTVTKGQPISWGPADAPVTIDLYEDFHCPHCAEFEEQFGPTLAAAQNAGQVRLRIFPMSFIDAGSASAANAFACAAEAGFGEAYYDGLFANHTLVWSDHQLIELARQVSADPVPADFESCVNDSRHADWVTSINDAAAEAGVTGTPTVFLDGKPVDLAGLTPDTLTAQITEAAQQ